jgi:DNA-binding MarR family transcriptional regulator
MEHDLKALFPKRSDFSKLAVRVLLDLEEAGPRKRSDLAEKFEMEPFEASRLLTKLESAGLVSRERDGLDKIVKAISPCQLGTRGEARNPQFVS